MTVLRSSSKQMPFHIIRNLHFDSEGYSSRLMISRKSASNQEKQSACDCVQFNSLQCVIMPKNPRLPRDLPHTHNTIPTMLQETDFVVVWFSPYNINKAC
jgi:hypothetical protein